jgi:putative ABC transport system permease protein
VNRRGWFLHFLGRSISQRKGRVAVASFAVMVASAIMVCAAGLSLGIRQKLGAELKAYGANVIITPTGDYLEEPDFRALSGEAGVEGASGQLYAAVMAKGAEAELIGLEMEKLKAQGWKVEGRWPGKGEALAGTALRDALGMKAGDAVTLAALGEGRPAGREVRVSGFVERGGPEDSAFLMDIAAARELTGLGGKWSAVLLRVKGDALSDTVAGLKKKFAGVAEVKTLRQVAYAEEAFLGKIELLMALVTVVVLAAAGISVSSTMSATVLERTREIGLMKAIGAKKREISRLYVAEGLVIGLIGGLAGFALGLASAEAVSRGAFGSFIRVPVYMLPASLALGALLTIPSSLLPLADALRRKPSLMLREE